MADRARLLDVHRELLERFRHSMNLVGPGPVDEHYGDSDAALAGLEPSGLWADLGTGAGFPGIVLAARWPDLEVELVDSRRKRCAFLEEVVERAGATGVRVRCARIEELEPERYDGVTARAVAPPEELLSLAARVVRPGGRAVLLLQADQGIPRPAGWVVLREHLYLLGRRARRVVELERGP